MKPWTPKETPAEYCTRRARETGRPYAVGAEGGALCVEGNARSLKRTGIRFYSPAPDREATQAEVSRFCSIDALARQMFERLRLDNPRRSAVRLQRVVYDTLTMEGSRAPVPDR